MNPLKPFCLLYSENFNSFFLKFAASVVFLCFFVGQGGFLLIIVYGNVGIIKIKHH